MPMRKRIVEVLGNCKFNSALEKRIIKVVFLQLNSRVVLTSN